MTAHCRFEPLEELSNDAIAPLTVDIARTTLFDVLGERGWCLMRGAARSLDEFRKLVLSLGVDVADKYCDLPRSGATDIFRTTPYPAEEDLLFHNEASHTPKVPRHIFFYSHQAAETGGFTPLSNGVDALGKLDETVADALRQHGLIYRRRFVEGLDVSWQDYFDTDDPDDVERQCQENGSTCSWTEGDILQVDFKTLAIGRLPDGRESMFHQVAIHHPAFLAEEIREYFTSYDPQGSTPRNVLLGDGSPLSDDWAREIVHAQNLAGQYFSWQAGDVLAVDNRICAHGRTHFSGPRENYVIMSRLESVKDAW